MKPELKTPSNYRWTWEEDGYTVVRTVCWAGGNGCHGGCGLLWYVKDGELHKVEGDKENPHNFGRLCVKAFSFPKITHHPDRITHPLKRVGERGMGKWERITWEEAYGEIVKRFTEIIGMYGASSILVNKGTGRGYFGWLSRLAYTIGTPNTVGPGYICYFPRLAAGAVTAGIYLVPDASQMFSDRYSNPSWVPPKCWVIWGKNPLIMNAAPSSFFGGNLTDLMRRFDTKFIVVDPRFTFLSARAEMWLQIRPATDAALALGILKVIIDEYLYDHEFVANWTNAPFLLRTDTKKLLRENDIKKNGSSGNFVVWDASKKNTSVWNSEMQSYDRPDVKPTMTGSYELPLMDGKSKCEPVWQRLIDRLKDYTPEKVEEITWIPKEKIREAARLYATSKPASIQWGVAIDQHTNSTQTSRAIALLMVLTGNLDVPGGQTHFDPGLVRGGGDWGWNELLTKLQQSRRIGVQFPITSHIGYFRVCHPETAFEAIRTGNPYQIRALLNWGSNPLACTYGNSLEIYETFKKLDFIVDVDLFMTPTNQMADIILPAASNAEKINIRAWWTPAILQNRALRLGEVKSDIEICYELGRRFKPDAWPWETLEEMLDYCIRPIGLTWKELRERGWIYPQHEYYKYEKGLLRKDGKNGFPTRSGKVELYSTIYEEMGLDPLPSHKEPIESPVSTPDLNGEYPLILTTGARTWGLLHSEGRNIDWMREIDADPITEIHPKTGKELGIKDGDWVYIETIRGRCKQKAKLFLGIDPRVVHSQHGWWFPEKTAKDLFGVFESNINMCTDNKYFDPGIGSTTLRGLLCKVYKVE